MTPPSDNPTEAPRPDDPHPGPAGSGAATPASAAPDAAPPTQSWRPPRWWGAVAGLATAAVALGAGQLAAGFAASLKPPVVSVGDRVVDAAPRWLKTFAIDTFGTNDKPALIAGTVMILTALAVLAGILALRHRLRSGLALVAMFAVVGMIAATQGRNGTGNGWVPSFIAGLAAAATLLLFRRLSYPPSVAGVAAVAPGDGAVRRTRRSFLVGGATVGATAVLAALGGARLNRRFAADLERAGVRPRRPENPLRAPPADPALGIAGLSPLFVANKDFYRIDTALITPSVTAEGWTLSIDGMVDRPMTLSYDDLWQREIVEYDVTLSCVSNEIGGGLVGNARWSGVRLDAVLAEAGVHPDADQIMGRSVDGFTAGFPVDALNDGRDAIIALTMNGEVLPVAHGYPARLVVPGLYGYVSATKWLSRIELTRFDRASGYWIPKGWSTLGPVKTQSRIDTPRQGGRTTPGDVVVAGVAWAPESGITKVEVQIDDGPWQPATLGPELATSSWRQWWFPWTATAGSYVLRCRATDGNGTTQTDQVTSVAPDGASGWHRVPIVVSA